jgi:6-phosphogluconolactonase
MRQEKAHAHFAMSSPDGRLAYLADLGTDRIRRYLRNPQNGQLESSDTLPDLLCPPGSGPRHLALHPRKPLLYAILELSAEIAVFEHPSQPDPTLLQRISLLTENESGHRQGAAIRIHPNGKWLYASNRGTDCLAVFTIAEDGKLTCVARIRDGLNWVRDFNLDPSGQWLLTASEKANELRSYRIHPQSGIPEFSGHQLTTPAPACIVFLPANGKGG